MKKYFTSKHNPKMEYYEANAVDCLASTLCEPDDEPYHTGLIDKYGNQIMAQNQIDQIGFIRR